MLVVGKLVGSGVLGAGKIMGRGVEDVGEVVRGAMNADEVVVQSVLSVGKVVVACWDSWVAIMVESYQLLAGAWVLGRLKNSHAATEKGDRARKKGVGG